MSRYSTLARIAIPAFTIAVLAALATQQPAQAVGAAAKAEQSARAVLSHGALDDILTGYVKVLIRNGQAGSIARERLIKLSGRPQRLARSAYATRPR